MLHFFLMNPGTLLSATRFNTVASRVPVRGVAASMLAVLLMTLCGQASAQHCTSRYSDETQNTSPTGVTFIAVSTFTLKCHGDITGSLNILSRGHSTTQLQIEKEDNGRWRIVERGNHIAYQAGPGNYRITIEEPGKRGGFVDWKIRYSKPLP